MNQNLSSKIVLVALLAAQNMWAAAPTNSAAATPAAPVDYSTFAKTITDRNIFDPNRVPGRVWTNRPVEVAVRNPPIAPVAASFSLVGIIGYSEGDHAGAYAFFDGSSQQFRKTTRLNGDIATFKVADIAADSVTLVSGTNEVVLPLGEQLRDVGGHWVYANGMAVTYNTSSSYGRSSSRYYNSNNNGGSRRRGNNNGYNNFNNGNNYNNGNNGGSNRGRNNYTPNQGSLDNSAAPDVNAISPDGMPGNIIVIPGNMIPNDNFDPNADPQNN